MVKTSLAQEGLTVVTYSQPKELTKCKKFLENPDDGALITAPQLFSGTEAANVIWVRDPSKNTLERSSTLRAIHKLCIIDPEPNLNVGLGIIVDVKVNKCHKGWSTALFWCKSKQTVLCHFCAAVCHPS